jgi:hypothetical protein
MAHLGWLVGILAAVLLAAALMLPLSGASTASSAIHPATASEPITATLNVGGSSTLLNRAFLGVNGGTDDSAVGTYLNSTSIGFVRTVGMDSCNVTTDTGWVAGVTGGIAIPNGCPVDIATFAAWCDSLTPHCESDVGLPGENNNSAEDAADARYIVDTLGFQPTYWSFGNEPISWTHYGIPWTHWKLTDDSVPTGLAYAVDVRNAIVAVRAVDPPAQFVGIQSYWCPDTTYTDPVAAIDGGAIDAMACHVYTNDGTSSPTTGQYFASLMGASNITSNYDALRQHIRGLCSTCGSLPIQISEFQGGPFGSPAPQDREFDGAIWLAASLVQALDAGIPSVQLYELGGQSPCGFCILNDKYVPDAQGVLYSGVLSDLQRGLSVYNVSVASHDTNLWATILHGTDPNHTQILFVNANVTHAETLGMATGFFGANQPGTVISWNDSSTQPVTTRYTEMPYKISVPALSLVLITVTPPSGGPDAHSSIVQSRGAVPVTVNSSPTHALPLCDAGNGFLSLPAGPSGSEGRTGSTPPFYAEPRRSHSTVAPPSSRVASRATGR